jgi:hypothetical protein
MEMLAQEIKSAQRLVKTDAYQMSIGEIVNMYKDKELVIDPEFQRLFRWELGQKSKLIESLLLGIPIPSIFVFEREDSKWELIDGLQRVSTILEFMGILKDSDGNPEQPSCLEATSYLPSMHNLVWEKSDLVEGVPEEEQTALGEDHKISVRRSRIAVEILKRPSDNNTKFDLFQRLNAGGTPANAQELRNCVIIMANRAFYTFLLELSENPEFIAVAGMTEDQISKQKPLEYVSRFMVHTFIPYDGKLDVEEYIDEGILRLAADGPAAEQRSIFEDTFRLLNEAMGGNALRRQNDGEPKGKVSLVAFEVIAIGIAKNITTISAMADPQNFVAQRIRDFWNRADLANFFSAGMRGTNRIRKTVIEGARWFSNEQA